MSDLEKLLESELLTADVKTGIREALESAKQTIREELEVSFAKKLIKDKADMNVKLVGVIDECVRNEISELKEDIENAHTLEVRYATKLEDFKQQYVSMMNEALNNAIGAYVEREFVELREDLLEAKQYHVFEKLMESFVEEFKQFGLTEDAADLQVKLEETTAELNATRSELKNASREATLEGLLANLQGNKREVMRTILETVSEDKLEDRYNASVKAVLSEESSPVIAPLTEGKTIIESINTDTLVSERKELRRLAGIDN